jgi:hypothetical protein
MRKIKSFKVFESVSDQISVLTDMSLELNDKGYLVDIYNGTDPFVKKRTYRRGTWGTDRFRSEWPYSSDNADLIFVWVYKETESYWPERFEYSEISNDLIDMIHYMESEGYSHTIDYQDIGVEREGYIKDDKLFYSSYDNSSNDEENLPFSWENDSLLVDICICFIPKKIDINEAWDSFDIQREEIKSIVGDMLIELDFQSIRSEVSALSDKVVQVELKKTVKDRQSAILFGDKDENRGFEWSDVESVINDVSDYLLKEWGLKPNWKVVPQTDVRVNWWTIGRDNPNYDSCMFLRWKK